MKAGRIARAAAVAIVAAAAVALLAAAPQEKPPAATGVVDASEFQTLQAAFDAVLSGNVVADVSRAEPGKHAALDLGNAEAVSGQNAVEPAKQ